ncbi:MAG TPA: amino acid adenylation domain-containing protein, partial [Longimicrobium sp.]|nr:amino acid adenylation domain-containing protein [Longimicrobium sp.]
MGRIIPGAGLPGSGPRAPGESYPLTPLQHGMLFESLLAPAAGVNVQQAVCRLAEAVDAERMERAWQTVAARHAVLRTRFRWADVPEPLQEVLPSVRVPVARVDHSALAPAEREAALEGWLAEDRARGFDLAAGPALRVALFRGAADEHVMVWSFHHVLLDVRSLTRVLREVLAVYDGVDADESAPRPFREHVSWLRARDGAADEAFWAERLRGIAGPEPVRGIRAAPRDPAAELHYGAREIVLSPEADDALRALERDRGVDASTVVKGAWACLLAAYTGRDEAVFGVVRGGRGTGVAGADGMVGLLINTVPLRVPLPADARVIDVLHAIAAGDAAVQPHEHAALPDVARWSGLPQGAALFDTIVNDQPAAYDAPLGGTGRAFHLREHPGYPLTLVVTGQAPLRMRIDYDAVLFDAAAIDRMLGHAARLLGQMAMDPDRPLHTLDPLAEAERALVVEAWNGTDAPVPADACIHHGFEAQAARTPDAVALVHERTSLTYAALNERANRLAHHLVRRGVGPEVRVGICLERGVDMVVCILAVLKAGGAYVGMDPAYPAGRLAFMIDDAAVAVLLTQARLRDRLPARDGMQVVSLEGTRHEIAVERADDPARGVEPRNLAYLIYTSGSTGTPKGVAIQHESAVVMLAWARATFSADELGGMLASTSISFDMSVFELFAPLVTGGRVIIVGNAMALPSSAAVNDVRLLDTVPSAAAALVKSGGIPASVRTVTLGGELLEAELVDALYAAGVERVYDLYGPSEDTTFSTFALRTPGGPVTIGRVLSNSRAYVLDGSMRPVPAGVPGELYLGGRGVTRGYLGRPSLTADRFVPDSIGGEPGARLYRTGDRVRWNPDGTLEYLGRLDHQVKVHGFRVELGEIEAVLRRAPGVADCVVVAGEDASGVRLVAYVAGAPAAEPVRAYLRHHLPEYMVPRAFVLLDALPLTPNGKLDRTALPAPDPASAADAYVAPRTPAEEGLAEILVAVLRIPRVGMRQTFVELGGHSLLATRVVSHVREAFGVELPLSALFDGATVADVAGTVEVLRGENPPVPSSLADGDRAAPLSFAQERLWFLDQLESAGALSNLPAALRLSGALDRAALERALGEIVRRHASLRTTFPEAGGVPVQRVAPVADFVLSVEELTALEDDAREAEVRRRIAEDAALPFDLAAGPLFRASLLRLADEAHVLLLALHPIVADAGSLGVLFRELSSLYGAFAAGEASPLPELPVQYADFAAWQRALLQDPMIDEQIAYWKEQLAGAPALLELPTDYPRPAAQSYRGAREPVALPPALVARLEALGRREDTPLAVVLLAAFQVLLGKYAVTKDVVVGLPVAGRTQPETEALIGSFVNTLVLRTDLGGTPTFREVLARVRTGVQAAFDHPDVPFERLVAELQPERSMSHAPLVQVLFALENAAESGPALPGLAVETIDADAVTTEFDLSFRGAVGEDGVRGVMEYSADLFERATIVRMLGHLKRLLEQVAEDADRPLSVLELVSAEERARVEAWNATEMEYPKGERIHTLFESWARRTPDAVVLEFGDVSVTYAEMDARANQLAHHLRRYGVGPEVRVALYLERGPELVAAVLGILKAGGAYVGLDLAYPAERLAFMLADSAAPVLVTREGLRGGLPAAEGLVVVSIDGAAAAEIAAESDAPLESGTVPHSLAHVMYTSGSTGIPKGVAIQHQSVIRLVHHPAYARLAPDEVMLQAGPISFDSSTLEIWSALLTGGRLAVLPSGAPSLEELGGVLRKHKVTVAWITSGLFQAMVEERLEDLGGMRQVMSGGDVLPAWHVLKVRERFPHIRVVNGYGPTENTVFTTCYTIPDGWSGTALPVGGPTPNTRVYVLDAALREVPLGVTGELFAAGDGLARGYLNRPALTAEKFVPDPFVPGARMYRTGDLGRWLPDGTIDFRGRIDTQVKIRGFRIEPGEVEALLRGQDGVGDCAVIVREDVPGDKRLVAYLVGDADVEAIRGRLRATLPDYLVPAAFVGVEALPLTPNGKLDRRALPAPDYAAGEYVAPRTPTEEVLAGIWAEVLRLDRVGVEENFFDRGGHSLLATRVVSRIREAFGVELPLRALFEGPTVAQFAQTVESLRRTDGAHLAAIRPVEGTDAPPLSFAQERLWFLQQLETESGFYNLPEALWLRGALDAAALERALGEIVRRHESLRTTFAQADGGPVQVIAPFAGFVLPIQDLSALDEDARETETRRRIAENAERPFDLAAGPLFRAELLRLSADEHVLLLCMHHIVSDGWSMGVLFGELSALYDAFVAGNPSPLPPLPVQYAAYAVWQREQLRGEPLERELAWWKAQLAGAPELLELPSDHPRPAVQTYRGASAPVQYPPALLDRLQVLGRREGATLYMVLLGAFQVLLGKYAGSEDVVVGSPTAGRTRGETEPLIGFFVNTLALRTDLSGNPAFTEVLRRVRAATLGAFDHQEAPFEQLVAELAPERSLSHAPLVQTMFALQSGYRGADVLSGARAEWVDADVRTAKFDLALMVEADANGIHGKLEYSTDLFEHATVERMLGHLERVLEQVAEDADRPIAALELLGADERAAVVDGWNRTDAPYRADVAVHRMVEEQAERAPGAVAVVSADASLTYGDLNGRANRLAHHLIRQGVGPEVRVGVCLERGPALVTALLGVMKTGAAYVALDPAYPADRLEFMMRDSGAPVLLTQDRLTPPPVAEGVRIIRVDGDWDSIASESAENPRMEVTPRNGAYVVYTSGSTGTPKGVAVEHAGLAALCAWHADAFGVTDVDRATQLASPGFDASAWELWPYLTRGASIDVVPEEVRTDPPA